MGGWVVHIMATTVIAMRCCDMAMHTDKSIGEATVLKILSSFGTLYLPHAASHPTPTRRQCRNTRMNSRVGRLRGIVVRAVHLGRVI